MSDPTSTTLPSLQHVFLEESTEGLDRAEAALLHLESATGDDVIGDLFRVIHSIKGGAGACGIHEITELAHTMENVLDDVRRGAPPTAALCAALMRGVDGLRASLFERAAGRVLPAARHADVCAELRVVRGEVPPPAAIAPAPTTTPPPAPAAEWRVAFSPHPALMQRGNDPLRILRAATELGAVVTADSSRVPALDALEPTECALAWHLTIPGSVPRAELEDLFSWVDGDCDLEIARATAASGATAVAAAPTAAPAAAVDHGIEAPRDREPSAEAAVAALHAVAAPVAAPSPAAAPAASLRVNVDKIDLLMNMVGELVITQSMLGLIDDDTKTLAAERLSQIREGLSQLARTTRSLQESVVQLRSTPVSAVFNRLPRLVHDLGARLGKAVALEITGASTELDKTILERLGDPLVHIVRNSIDHGIETAEVRVAAGKPAGGTIRVHAEHRGSAIIIRVEDDGRGLDLDRILAVARARGVIAPDATPTPEEITKLIFAPGFSTASQVSEVSGRGVGMDVVWRHIHDLGGEVSVESTPGKGTRTSLRLPLTLSIIEGQLIRLGDRHYVVPLLSIVESLEMEPKRRARVAGGAEIYRVRDQIVPVVDLAVELNVRAAPVPTNILMIVEADGQTFGLLVDELLAQQQVVIKSLEANYGRVDSLAGATVLGDGNVAFIIDVASLARNSHRQAA